MLWPIEVERAVKRAISSSTFIIRKLTSADEITTLRAWHLSSMDKPNRSWKLSPTEDAVTTHRAWSLNKITDSVLASRDWSLSSGDKPNRSWVLDKAKDSILAARDWVLSSADKPGRSWKLDKLKDSVLSARDWTLSSADKPDRSWVLDKAKDTVTAARDWVLSSADKPGRSWNLNQNDDFVRNFRAFNQQQLVSQQVIPKGGVIFTTIVNADMITASFAKARRQTYASLSVDHYVRVYSGAPWTKLGNTSDYKDLVVTIEHKVYEYKAVNVSTTSLIITAGVRRML